MTLAGSAARGDSFSRNRVHAALGTPDTAASPGSMPGPEEISAVVQEGAERDGLRAVIYRFVVDGQEVVTGAFGESMSGEPATVDMHFRNGAVAIGYLATALLTMVDEGLVGLDDTLDAWLPDLDASDTVTFRMLLNMTAGYPDYVPNSDFVSAFYRNPFCRWTGDELIGFGLAQPRRFAPGENWDYSHTNMVVLGRAMEAIIGQPLAGILRARVLDPLGLHDTVSERTAAISRPILHSFSSERKADLGIPPDTAFYEESTFWSPSWTLAPGSVMTTNISDMTTTAIDWGAGTLLSPASHAAMTDPALIGFGTPLDGCRSCHTLDERFSYGLGLVLSNGWLMQTPRFGGYAGVAAYLPAEKIACAVMVTFAENGFDERGEQGSNTSAIELVKRMTGLLTDQTPLL